MLPEEMLMRPHTLSRARAFLTRVHTPHTPYHTHSRNVRKRFYGPLILFILSHKQVPPLLYSSSLLYSVYTHRQSHTTHTADFLWITCDHSPHTTAGRGARAAHQCVQNAPCVYDYVS